MALDRRVERHDREGGDDQRQENPREPLLEQARQPAAAEDEHREIAAQQEEEWHPEAMHGPDDQDQQVAPLGVAHGPGKRHEAQRRMQGDAQQHGEAPQGIEIDAPRCDGGCMRCSGNDVEIRWAWPSLATETPSQDRLARGSRASGCRAGSGLGRAPALAWHAQAMRLRLLSGALEALANDALDDSAADHGPEFVCQMPAGDLPVGPPARHAFPGRPTAGQARLRWPRRPR